MAGGDNIDDRPNGLTPDTKAALKDLVGALGLDLVNSHDEAHAVGAADNW